MDIEGYDDTTADKVNADNDDEEDDEVRADGTTTETDPEPVDRRDEVDEVRKMSSKETGRLRLWRLVVTSVLLLTAFAVTFTTYTLLEEQEDENFKTAVSFETRFLLTCVSRYQEVANLDFLFVDGMILC